VKPHRAEAGVSLLETMVVLMVIGVLAVPAFSKFGLALEQTRVDNAAAALETIWRAQRMHRFETGTFITDMNELERLLLVETALVQQTEPFEFSLLVADIDTFTAQATRTGSGVWAGALTIDEVGTLDGSTQDGEGHDVTPGQL